MVIIEAFDFWTILFDCICSSCWLFFGSSSSSITLTTCDSNDRVTQEHIFLSLRESCSSFDNLTDVLETELGFLLLISLRTTT